MNRQAGMVRFIGIASPVRVFEYQRRVLALANRAAVYSLDRLDRLVAQLRGSPFESVRKRLTYFETLLKARGGEDERARALKDMEKLALTAEAPTRACALLSLGYFAFIACRYDTVCEYYHEAAEFVSSDSPLLLLRLIKNQAAMLAFTGDHFGALRLLESVAPLARAALAVEPLLYFDWLNSWSLEMGEAGRFDEAIGAARVVALSSAARVVPAWSSSLDEIVELRARRRRMRPLHTPAVVIPLAPRVEEAEHLRNRLRLFRAAINGNLSPALVKLGADCMTRVSEQDAPMVQRVIESLAGVGESKACDVLTMRSRGVK